MNQNGTFRWLAQPTVRRPACLLGVPDRFCLDALIVELSDLGGTEHIVLVDDVVLVSFYFACRDTEFLALLIFVDTSWAAAAFSRVDEVLIHLFGLTLSKSCAAAHKQDQPSQLYHMPTFHLKRPLRANLAVARGRGPACLLNFAEILATGLGSTISMPSCGAAGNPDQSAGVSAGPARRSEPARSRGPQERNAPEKFEVFVY
jgi:hypothetical protein